MITLFRIESEVVLEPRFLNWILFNDVFDFVWLVFLVVGVLIRFWLELKLELFEFWLSRLLFVSCKIKLVFEIFFMLFGLGGFGGGFMLLFTFSISISISSCICKPSAVVLLLLVLNCCDNEFSSSPLMWLPGRLLWLLLLGLLMLFCVVKRFGLRGRFGLTVSSRTIFALL